VKKLTARFIHAFICVRPEIVALSLQQICRQTFCTVLFIVGQSSAHCRNSYAQVYGCLYHIPLRILAGNDNLFEIWIQKQICQVRFPVKYKNLLFPSELNSRSG
jgi:hypothetical protein